MSRMLLFLTLFSIAGVTAIAQQAAPSVVMAPASVDPVAAALGALRAGQIQTAEMQMALITNPAAKLFVKACIERASKDPKRAIQTVVGVIVQYPNDPEWTAKSELLSVMLYLELGMLDAADATARQIQMIYEGTAVAEKATALRSKIEKLKKEMESK